MLPNLEVKILLQAAVSGEKPLILADSINETKKNHDLEFE